MIPLNQFFEDYRFFCNDDIEMMCYCELRYYAEEIMRKRFREKGNFYQNEEL